MKRTALAAAIAGISILAVHGAHAEPQGQAATPPQSSPGGQMMGGGPGSGMGMGMGMRSGAQNTYGWSMMSSAERQEHMTKMHGFTTAADCRAYVAEHHKLMVERAKQRGMSMPAEPPHDPCAGLK